MKKLIYVDSMSERLESVIRIGGKDINGEHPISAECVLSVLKSLPTVDAEPVRHGRWIKKRYWSEGVGMGERYGYYYSCSKCGNLVCGGYNECGKKYCDECGAKMDGKDDEK